MTVVSKGEIWFVSIPLFGHLGPLLLQGDELARRGWSVTVATGEEGRPAVERWWQSAQACTGGGGARETGVTWHATHRSLACVSCEKGRVRSRGGRPATCTTAWASIAARSSAGSWHFAQSDLAGAS